jgi:hypothetical protein
VRRSAYCLPEPSAEPSRNLKIGVSLFKNHSYPLLIVRTFTVRIPTSKLSAAASHIWQTIPKKSLVVLSFKQKPVYRAINTYPDADKGFQFYCVFLQRIKLIQLIVPAINNDLFPFSVHLFHISTTSKMNNVISLKYSILSII